jgi:hypothetical protein
MRIEAAVQVGFILAVTVCPTVAAKAVDAIKLAPAIIEAIKIFLIFILVSVAVNSLSRRFPGHPYPVIQRIRCCL